MAGRVTGVDPARPTSLPRDQWPWRWSPAERVQIGPGRPGAPVCEGGADTLRAAIVGPGRGETACGLGFRPVAMRIGICMMDITC